MTLDEKLMFVFVFFFPSNFPKIYPMADIKQNILEINENATF